MASVLSSQGDTARDRSPSCSLIWSQPPFCSPLARSVTPHPAATHRGARPACGSARLRGSGPLRATLSPQPPRESVGRPVGGRRGQDRRRRCRTLAGRLVSLSICMRTGTAHGAGTNQRPLRPRRRCSRPGPVPRLLPPRG